MAMAGTTGAAVFVGATVVVDRGTVLLVAVFAVFTLVVFVVRFDAASLGPDAHTAAVTSVATPAIRGQRERKAFICQRVMTASGNRMRTAIQCG